MFRLPKESDCTRDSNQLFPQFLKSIPLFLNLAPSVCFNFVVPLSLCCGIGSYPTVLEGMTSRRAALYCQDWNTLNQRSSFLFFALEKVSPTLGPRNGPRKPVKPHSRTRGDAGSARNKPSSPRKNRSPRNRSLLQVHQSRIGTEVCRF